MSPLQCEDLSKKFREVLAVDRLTLEVPEGSIFALTGPNGAGKTTAIKMMRNIIPPDTARHVDEGIARIITCLSSEAADTR